MEAGEKERRVPEIDGSKAATKVVEHPSCSVFGGSNSWPEGVLVCYVTHVASDRGVYTIRRFGNLLQHIAPHVWSDMSLEIAGWYIWDFRQYLIIIWDGILKNSHPG